MGAATSTGRTTDGRSRIDRGCQLGYRQWMAVQNERKAAADLQKLQTSLERDYDQVIDDLQGIHGAQHVRRQLLQRLLQGYRRFIDDSRKISARTNLAMGLVKLGAIYHQLGDQAAGKAALIEAQSIYQSLAVRSPSNIEHRLHLANSSDLLGQVLSRLGETQAAEEAMQNSVEHLETLLARYPENLDMLAAVARANNNLALLMVDTGRKDRALQLLENTRARIEGIVITDNPNETQKTAVSTEPAQPAGSNGNSDTESIVRNDKPGGTNSAASFEHAQLSQSLAATYNNLSELVRETDPPAAITYYQRSIDVQLELARQSDSQTPTLELGVTYCNLGRAYARNGDDNRALDAYERAPRHTESAVSTFTQQSFVRTRSEHHTHNEAQTLIRLKRREKAEQLFGQAIQLSRHLLSERPDDASVLHELGGMYNNLAMSLEEWSDPQRIADAFENALQCQRRAVELAPKVQRYREFLDNHLVNYSAWLRRQGKDDRVLELTLQRRELWPGDGRRQMAIAAELADTALQKARIGKKNANVDAYLAAVRESVRLALEADPSVQSSLSKEPFSSLAKIRSLTD